MSKSNSFENAILSHIFLNTAIADIGNAGGLPAAGVAGNLYVRLYTNAVVVDDATIGTECAYTGYVAKGVAVARTSGGWTLVANSVSNTALIPFGKCTAGSEVAQYFAIWKDNVATAETSRLFWGQLTDPLNISLNITPGIDPGTLIVNEN